MRAVVTWALSLPPFVPLCICCDSQLVLGGVSGSTKPPCQSPLQGVNAHARCVQQLHESLGSAISFLWTPGHVGISGNECADAVAAAFSSCSHLPDSKIPAAVERLWAHPLLPWAWATVRQYDLPALSTLPTAAYEPPEIPSQRNIQSVLDDVAADPGPSEGFSFKLCTANVCSLRGKHHLLRAQLEGEQVAVCGIQETRSPSDSAFVSGNWLCFHSAAVKGHHGCALWLDRCRLRSLGGSLASPMSKEHCCVLDARPDWLAVRVTWGVLDSVFVVLHAPHTGHSPDARTEWWKRAGRDLRGYAKSAPLVMLGDFNAEPSCFDKPGIGQLALEVPDHSGELAAPVINDLGLVLVNTFPSAACPHTYAPTWRHKMIDFIGVPLRWQQGATQVRTCLDLGTSHDDHNAVVIKLCLPVSKKPPPKKPRSSVKTRAAAAYAPGVRVPWHCGVHEHAEKLFSVAKHCKPLAPPVKTKPFLSSASLTLLADKKQAKHNLKAALREEGVALLRLCFRVWSRRRVPPRPSGLRVALCLQHLQRTTRGLAASVKHDKAVYINGIADSIRDVDAKDEGSLVYKALRYFRPAGKSVKKPFYALPILEGPDGEVATSFQGQQELRARYFGQMEAAIAMDAPTRVHAWPVAATAPATFALSDVPSLLQIEDCVRSLPLCKAPGPSQVPNEVWREHPAGCARDWMPVFLKAHKRLTEPFRFSVGLLFTLYKQKGPQHCLKSFRSIFLLEGLGKGFRKLLRHCLIDDIRLQAPALFAGCLPGSLTGALTHYLCTAMSIAAHTAKPAGFCSWMLKVHTTGY